MLQPSSGWGPGAAAKRPTMHRTAPQQRTMAPQVSVILPQVLRRRNSAYKASEQGMTKTEGN